jgi:hypothetical protein
MHFGPSQRPSASAMRRVPSAASEDPQGRGQPTAQSAASEDPNLDVPGEELSSPQRANVDPATVAYDPDSLETLPSTPNLRANTWLRVSLSSRSSRRQGVIIALAATSLALGLWLTLRRPAKPPTAITAPKSPVLAPKPAACGVARAAQRVTPSVLMSIAPIVSESPIAGRMAVGFAEGPTTAAGITIDPTDLDVNYPFRETKESRIVSVAPLLLEGKPSFLALRDNQALKQARAVDASQDFLFGLSESGFARQPIGGAIETVWAVDSRTNLTDPRLSSLSGLAHAVTFRQGGQTGSIMLGWLTQEGRALAGPFQVKSVDGFVGTPALAAGAGRALVAYAGRATETDAWSIFLSQAEVGQPPRPAIAFEQPPGGPGGDSIAPALVSLPNQRWLLQWSEGPQGQRQVRLQTLDRDLGPIGPAHQVSPIGSNSGQGLLWSMGQRAVSLFIVSVGRSAELWATPINCPE